MHHTKRIGMLAATAAIALVALAPVGSYAAEPSVQANSSEGEAPSAQMMVVNGTIEAVEKSILGKAKSVQIVSEESGTFLIDDTGKGAELKNHIGEEVTVTAQLRIDDGGQKIPMVKRFELPSS